MMFAGWINRHQLDVIDYLQEENRVLKERLAGAASVSPTPNVDGSPKKRTHWVEKYWVNWKRWSRQTPCYDGTGNWWH